MGKEVGLGGVLPPHEKSDMVLVGRLRSIFKNKATETARLLLSGPTNMGLGFWYHEKMHETSQCYWSENHSLMYTTSEYLLRQFCDEPVSKNLRNRLVLFLKVKAKYGLAEFMSPVYLTYTICSLLNLIDYEKSDEEINHLATCIMDDIAEKLFDLILSDGSFISPHGRGYQDQRNQTKGLHLHVFIDFLLHGRVVSGKPGLELHDCLCDTTYRYKAPEQNESEREKEREKGEGEGEEIQEGQRRIQNQRQKNRKKQKILKKLSPPRGELEAMIEGAPDDVYLTILFSHGIYFPLQTKNATRILRTMKALNLWHHPHFRAGEDYIKFFACIPDWLKATFLVNVASCFFKGLAAGSYLTDASMIVYREENVILSSLCGGYNAGMACFQQWPWAINLNGIPIWCSFGTPSDGGLGQFGSQTTREMSSNKIMPRMTQKNHILIADYRERCHGGCFRLPPPKCCSCCCFACGQIQDTLTMRWPKEDFDEYGERSGWCWARKGTACCAYSFPKKHVIKIIVCDQKEGKGIISLLQEEINAKNHVICGGRQSSDYLVTNQDDNSDNDSLELSRV